MVAKRGSYPLSEEALVRLLQHMSLRPRNQHWRSRVSPHSILNVLRSGTALSIVARQEFQALAALGFRGATHALTVNTKDEAGKCFFKDLIEELGRTLKELWIDFVLVSLADVAKHLNTCSNLKSLHVSSSRGAELITLLPAFSGQLLELGVKGTLLEKTAVRAIAEHCVGLRTLRLYVHMCEDVLTPLWDSVGPSLEELSFLAPFLNRPGASVLECFDLSSKCVKLTTLEIESPSRVDSAAVLVHLCKQLGPQLQVLREPPMNHGCLRAEDYAIILKSCSNVMINAREFQSEHTVVSTLADRLRSLRVCCYDCEGSIPESGYLMKNLEELEVVVAAKGRCRRFFSKFLSTPLPRLRSLRICGILCDLRILQTLAKLVTTLEEFSCEFEKLRPGCFLSLVQSNPLLQHVFLAKANYIDISGEKAEVEVIWALNDFSNCSLLIEIVFENRFLNGRYPRIAEACIPFRNRAVDIFLGGVQYLL